MAELVVYLLLRTLVGISVWMHIEIATLFFIHPAISDCYLIVPVTSWAVVAERSSELTLIA
jgi:hypothetical protein